MANPGDMKGGKLPLSADFDRRTFLRLSGHLPTTIWDTWWSKWCHHHIKASNRQASHLLSWLPSWCTGHSLGAGTAAIATLALQSVYSNVFAYCCACFSCISLNLLPRLQNCVITVNTALLRSTHELLGDAPSPRCFRFYESELANDRSWFPYLFSRTWSTICGSSSQVGTIFSHHLRTTDRILFRRSKLAGMNPVGSQNFLIPLFLRLTRENCQTKLPL